MGLISTENAIWLALSRVARVVFSRNVLVLSPPIALPNGTFVVPIGTREGITHFDAKSRDEADALYRTLLWSAQTSTGSMPLDLHVAESCGSLVEFEDAWRSAIEPSPAFSGTDA